MRAARPWIVVGAGLYLAAVLDAGAAEPLSIGAARPQFLLAFLTAFALCLPPRGSLLCGFGAGVLQGALAGANLTHYVISRTLSAFLVSWSRSLKLDPKWWVVGLYGAATCFVAQAILMFLAPPPEIGPFLGATILSAFYTGAITVPTFAAARRVLEFTYG